MELLEPRGLEADGELVMPRWPGVAVGVDAFCCARAMIASNLDRSATAEFDGVLMD
jgi:hypothetical protein